MPGRTTPEVRSVPAPSWSSNSLSKNTAHTVSTSLTEEDADWIVRRTELRVSQVIAKSQYVQHHCRLDILPRFAHEDMIVGRLIASGGFSNVHHIESFGPSSVLDADRKNYVVKHLNPKLANEPKKMAVGAKDLVMEAHFLASLNHKNIIQLRGMCAAGVAGYAETGRAEGFFLIFDQLERTLSQQLQQWRQIETRQQLTNAKHSSLFSSLLSHHKGQKNMITFQERIRTAHDIACAVTYLHERNILYRDLKPGNCGYDEEGNMVIFDFGLAVELPHSEDPNQLYNLAGNTGTARYMAPEVIKNKPYNFKADVFSFTTLLWEIVALKKPFADLSGQDVKEWVADLGNRPHISKTWPQALRKLMKAGWSVELDARPTMKEVRDTLASLLN